MRRLNPAHPKTILHFLSKNILRGSGGAKPPASLRTLDIFENAVIWCTMHIDTDIAIVGGGPNGMTLALALQRCGLNSVIVDQLALSTQSAPEFDGRGYALSLTSVRLLKALGLWAEVQDAAQPMLGIRVSDGRIDTGPSPFAMEFDHAEIEEGPMGHMLEDRHLRPALIKAVRDSNSITYLEKTTVLTQDVSAGAVDLTTDTGTTVSARLQIGADGRRSQVAQRAGIRKTGWSYDQTALVCAVQHDLPHNGIAHQYFLPSGPLAILPLPGNRSSIVWTETTKNARAIMALNEADYLDVIRPRFGEFLGEISLVGHRYSYPLDITIASEFVQPRLALIGDAAHGVHPIAGQGLNAGYKDIAALVHVLEDAKMRGEDIGALNTLSRYQEWRRFDVQTLGLATDTFNKIFSNDRPLLRMGRDLGLGLVNKMPALRRAFIREAAGLSGDLPRLMQ